MTGPIWPKIQLVWDLMPVLVTSKFDEDPIKSLETPFHYKSMGNFLDAQGHQTPKGEVQSGQNLNLSEILCPSCKFDADKIKTEGVSMET